VFPVSGEIVPLTEYLTIIRSFDGLIYLDDAHAVGVLGEHGRGTRDYFHIDDPHCRSTATLSKGLGGYGGIIWGEASWINYIDRESRICAGASPLPLILAAASTKALSILKKHPEIHKNLLKNVQYARDQLRSLGWDLDDTPVPIICLEALPGISLKRIKKKLFEQSIAVEIVRSYPSAPAGGAIRLVIFATHTKTQIDRLVLNISKCM
jgi:8-amino-7-oxononanoate synthase